MKASTASISLAFKRMLDAKRHLPDKHQETALVHFDRLAHELTGSDFLSTDGPLALIQRRLRLRSRESPAGIYLWGSVGRGKTMMMDVFFDTVSGKRKRRVHFHRFMLELHQRLKLLQRQQDPLMQVSREIGQDVALLCLDEFFVSDIGDAMVLSQLLHGLANNGVTLVFTSNTKPDQLYKDGFQRDRFLPAIDLIKDRTVVAHLDGNTDYRLELLDRSDVYLSPNDAAAQSQMQSLFTHMVSTIPVTAGSITINDRRIQTRTHGEGVIWFEFNALCEGPRSKVDYVELSRSYHTILISGIPQLNDSQDDIVRRFIELIDELYDRRVKVIVSADSCPEDLYSGNRLSAPFNRTISRLNAFQSGAYLSLAHSP